MWFRPPLLTDFQSLLDYLSPFWITRFLGQRQTFFAQRQVQSLQQAVQEMPIKTDKYIVALDLAAFQHSPHAKSYARYLGFVSASLCPNFTTHEAPTKSVILP